jgi:hypothetical protein
VSPQADLYRQQHDQHGHRNDDNGFDDNRSGVLATRQPTPSRQVGCIGAVGITVVITGVIN